VRRGEGFTLSAVDATIAAHADWSIDPRKRFLAVARRAGVGWRMAAPEPVGDVTTLCARLLAAGGGGAVALGVDLPLGLPRAYVARWRLGGDFPSFLRGPGARPGFFEVCTTLAEVSAARPFYPRRAVKGMTRAAHAAALGLAGPAGLSRRCDRATAERPAGAPLFWTLGANQSGRAAIAAWRYWLIPALDGPVPPRLWPFEGDLGALLAPGVVVVAETYPAEALRQLGLKLAGSKRRQADRVALSGALAAVMARLGVEAAPALAAALAEGFGARPDGEDRLDCVLGALAVVNVLAGGRPDGVPPDPWLSRWEGWVLGQTALPPPLPGSGEDGAKTGRG
jgi:hypothetical protein